MNTRRRFVEAGGRAARFAGLMVLLWPRPALPAAAEKPNVVVILVDDLGRGDYSHFGTPDLRTPNIDRLYREGMDLVNFRANSPVCSPSRAALMTGCYPDRVGVPGLIREEDPANNWGFLAPAAVTLPQRLRAAGYDTALVGKWNLGLSSPNLPNERGFGFFHGFLGDMMDDYRGHLRHGQNLLRRNGEPVQEDGHATDLFTKWACAYLQEPARQATPFFLYLAYTAPHEPLQPPPEWLERVQQREPGLMPPRAKLVALIEHLDDGLGRVLATLDETGLAAKTLVIFNSDNGGVRTGGANNGPWRSGKGHMYEGGLRVPCAARWPEHIRAGSRTETPALTMDLFATVLEAAGAPAPEGIDGHSLLPHLLGEEKADPPRDAYFVRREGGLAFGGKTIEAFQRGPWKLLQDSPYAPMELYNLQEDPAETTNQAETAPEKLRELAEGLRRQIQRAGGVPWER